MASLKGSDEAAASDIPERCINQWDNDFVQSLQTPYGEPEYRERAETLVKEVKILLKEMQSGDGDLIERLEMVDALQCLGIDRYFQAEIKEALDYVYVWWDGSAGMGLGSGSVTKDLNATALGLRLLRLHRYRVSADVLEKFKNKSGQFFFSEGNSDNMNIKRDEYVMRSMLNLLRASSVAFPGEEVMEEAKLFSSIYLKQFLQECDYRCKEGFLKEVEYTLLYNWTRTFSRWEARNIIEIYELDNLSWWIESGITKLISIRQRPIEYYLLGVSAMDGVEFHRSRIALTKSTTLLSIMDDLLDDHLTFEQAELVIKAIIQGWDVSIIQDIPTNFKKIVEFIFETVHEMASEATQKQGYDMMPFITKAWADYVEASLQQACWNVGGHIPTYNEYIKIAVTTAAIGPLLLHPLLLAADGLGAKNIEKTFNNQCRFYEIIWLLTRLIDDVHDYEDDKLHGQTASAISCYMMDHQESSEEEAINHINYMIGQLLKEFTWEFLKADNTLFYWESITSNFNRGLQCFYVYGDGFSYHDKGNKERIIKILIDPIQL